MDQRQLRLGDILDDYCPRERRVTNHAVVAMVGADVKQTRCTTCDTEHEYKHAKVPRQRRKADSPAALYAQVSANAPKRVVHDAPAENAENAENAESVPIGDDEMVDGNATSEDDADSLAPQQQANSSEAQAMNDPEDDEEPSDDRAGDADRDEGPVHRPLIRASLPRPEGQPPPSRPIPEFTIRQPTGRPGHFRSRPGRGGGGPQQFQGNRSTGNVPGGPSRGGPRQGGGRPSQGGGGRRHGGPEGRKRSK